MPEPSNEELMERFVGGDMASFDQLFTRQAPLLQGFLLRMVGDKATAEDLLQITFMSVLRSKDRYEVGLPVGPWLTTIAANAARDTLRRKAIRTKNIEDTQASEGDANVPPPNVDPGARKALLNALEQLPHQQREAVVLHKVEGFSFEQIAEQLQITATAARIRAHRGYERLRELLASVEDL
jgi:RNA polymerase sigma factor (sigma-70 family)